MKAGTFTSLLLLVFIGLKLANFISWAWWVVLTPLWIPILISCILFVILNLF